jgi:hypothetical protein
MAASADRNLLFGILALQMDFITRDQLVEGMNAWVLAKERPLGELLVVRKTLSAARRILLDSLVQEHIAQHGNDPLKSLAALASVTPIKKELQSIADGDVQQSIAWLDATTTVGDSGHGTGSVPGDVSSEEFLLEHRTEADGDAARESIAATLQVGLSGVGGGDTHPFLGDDRIGTTRPIAPPASPDDRITPAFDRRHRTRLVGE